MISFKMKPENHAILSRWWVNLSNIVFVVAAGYLWFVGVVGCRYPGQARSVAGMCGVRTGTVSSDGIRIQRIG